MTKFELVAEMRLDQNISWPVLNFVKAVAKCYDSFAFQNGEKSKQRPTPLLNAISCSDQEMQFPHTHTS